MKRLLVVDDSEMARMFVRRCLEAIGFSGAEFFEAANGKEALAVMSGPPIDLVVTDLTMPVMNGEELLHQIKATPELKATPVMVITSAGNKATAKELMDSGALAVLSKPFSPAELYTILQPYLGAAQ